MHSSAISFISNWQKVDLVSYFKALIIENLNYMALFIPPQFQVKGCTYAQVHCCRYDMSTEHKYSENGSAETYG